MGKLADEKCSDCRDGGAALTTDEIKKLRTELNAQWQVTGEHHLERTWKFPDFQKALDFTNKLGAIAEEQGHHPDIYLTWGKVRINIFTHKINGLTKSDFVLAAKFDGAS